MSNSAESRRVHRNRVLKGATIIISIKQSEIPCIVRNQSAGGAELKVPADITMPEKFLRYVAADGVAYRSVVRWRRKDRVGVEFLGTEPKPKLHYG